MVVVRTMSASELAKIRNIDRSEEIRLGYRQEGAELIEMTVDWDTPGWYEGDGEHSFSEIIRGAERCLSSDGTAIGAFDGERLVGIATYRPRLTETMGQLDLLHVSDGYRRQGIASLLFAEMLSLALRDGAAALYVSATPSESAVGFYASRGFRPTDAPHPELLALEPEDIHMILPL